MHIQPGQIWDARTSAGWRRYRVMNVLAQAVELQLVAASGQDGVIYATLADMEGDASRYRVAE